MTVPLDLSRRVFLADLGQGSIALALLGVAACGPAGTATPGGPSASAHASAEAPANGFDWERVNLGFVSGSNPGFTADMAAAEASVAKMGALRFETLLVGHGEPITSGASGQVAALAAST